jgi:hypothetical protein
MARWGRAVAAILILLGLPAAPEATAQPRPQDRRVATPAQAKAGPPARAAPRPQARTPQRPTRPRDAGPSRGPARPQARPAPRPPAETPEERRLRVAETVRQAARETGFDPELLLAIAMAESSLREGVGNPRSSAAGPMQFTTPTWLAAVHGLADRVPALAPHRARLLALAERELVLSRTRMAPARRRAALAALRREQAAVQRAALALRHDTATAARVAAVLAQEDAERFRRLTGEAPASPGQIYAVHLLGVGAAAALARAERQRPSASVAEVLPPGVLRANREIFLGEDGRPLPIREAGRRIAARLQPAEPPLLEMAEAQ